jgi:hypothetical protein
LDCFALHGNLFDVEEVVGVGAAEDTDLFVGLHMEYKLCNIGHLSEGWNCIDIVLK